MERYNRLFCKNQFLKQILKSNGIFYKILRIVTIRGSGYCFFKNDLQYSVRELLFENPCSLRNIDDFSAGIPIVGYSYGKCRSFQIDPDLFFRNAGKTDADVNIPAFISHSNLGVECSTVVESFAVFHGSKSFAGIPLRPARCTVFFLEFLFLRPVSFVVRDPSSSGITFRH